MSCFCSSCPVSDLRTDTAAAAPTTKVCGSISGYNTKEPYNVKNLQLLIWREIHLYGFLAFSLMPKYREEFFRTMPSRVASGEIKYKEHRVKGLENAGQAILNVQSGKNTGKMVVVVADE